MERPSWDELFVAISVLNSSRGSCSRLRTSCVLVQDHKIVGSGYNGAVAKNPNCDEVGHLMIGDHCLRTLHGERNALANAKKDNLTGATAYVIATPCLDCVKELLQHGISRIVYVGEYKNALGSDFIADVCNQTGASLEQLTADPKDVATIFHKIFTRLRGSGGIFKNTDLVNIFFEGETAEIKESMKKNGGKLIIFEGIDKSGKSLQMQRLIGYLLTRGYEVLECREPPFPDSKIGIPDIRHAIMTFDSAGPDLLEKELELFESVRRILYSKVIIPALEKGIVVVCDRGPDSTTAFQGYGRGVNLDKIREANRAATFGKTADLTFLFDLEPAVAMRRVTNEDRTNRFEKEPLEFHNRVKMGYLQEAVRDTERKIKNWQVIWADDNKDTITKKIIGIAKKRLGL